MDLAWSVGDGHRWCVVAGRSAVARRRAKAALCADTGRGDVVTLIQRRLLLLAPLGFAAIGGASFWALLERMREGTYDPHGVPSMLIGKPLPDFSLPGQPPSPGFSSADVIGAGRPVLINFFASWCIPCVQEAPVLMTLKQQGVPIWGIAYK